MNRGSTASSVHIAHDGGSMALEIGTYRAADGSASFTAPNWPLLAFNVVITLAYSSLIGRSGSFLVLDLLLGQTVGMLLSTGHLTIVTHFVDLSELLVRPKEIIRSD